MAEWWEGLNDLQKLFYYFAVPSTVLLLIQTILSLFALGGGSDADFDASDVSVDTDAGLDTDAISEPGIEPGGFIADFKFFSLRGIIAFFTILGWVGVILSGTDMNSVLIFTISIIAGIGADIGIGLLFYFLNRLQSKGNINLANAIGKVGEVYIPIPEKGAGRGKIQITVQERLVEADAVSEENFRLATGSLVRVTGLVDGNMLKVRKND